MKVKFSNGVAKNCASPTEQKVFRTADGTSGWILHLRLLGEITSTELDEILNVGNVSSLEFSRETEDGKDVSMFTLLGYEKITSSTIRHAETIEATVTEIQLTKGI